MRWFGKKPQANNNSAPVRGVSSDAMHREVETIEPYDPCCGLVPVEYRVSSILSDLEDKFESDVAQFLQNADPDKFNGSFMDARIAAALEDTLADLCDQKAAHRNTIEVEIVGLWEAMRLATVNKLKNTMEELDEVDRKLAKRIRIMNHGTAFEEDTFDTEGF